MNNISASNYILDNYAPTDRLAVVIKYQRGGLIQRIGHAEKIAASDFQGWLQRENARGGNVYLSVNALNPAASGRTRGDVGEVRHVYLDIDIDGDNVLRRILREARVPQPSYVLSTSPGKYQTVWKVEGFTLPEAEALQRSMAATFGADRAVVDAARVLRLPGFDNCKYTPPHLVIAERLSSEIFRPEHFQVPTPELSEPVMRRILPRQERVSQSERDWAETMRRLRKGEAPRQVQAWLEHKRQDKRRPAYYSAMTVEKALAELERRRSCQPDPELSSV